MKTVEIKSQSALNYISIDGVRYHPPEDSKFCCWDKVNILSKDSSRYCKWIVIHNEYATEIWKVK